MQCGLPVVVEDKSPRVLSRGFLRREGSMEHGTCCNMLTAMRRVLRSPPELLCPFTAAACNAHNVKKSETADAANGERDGAEGSPINFR
jgi:hypothetical protein